MPPSASLPANVRIELELDPERILATVETLRMRIEERFPGSGLGRVAATLKTIGDRTLDRLDWVARPHLLLRGVTWLVAAVIMVGLLAGLATLQLAGGIHSALDWLQAVESGLQDAVFIGLGLVFLITVESRIKRRRAIRFIRELRALAHIVDMHQLTKDPDRLVHGSDTASSPRRTLTHDDLGRYLDYCSELLSLTSKVASLYGERLHDPVVLQAVDQLEALTTGLSGKIWQKIMILDAPEFFARGDGGASRQPPSSHNVDGRGSR